jgi:hypothetical protein
MSVTFLRRDGFVNIFAFTCDRCHRSDELRLNVSSKSPFQCPEECGAVYVQLYPNRVHPMVTAVDLPAAELARVYERQ